MNCAEFFALAKSLPVGIPDFSSPDALKVTVQGKIISMRKHGNSLAFLGMEMEDEDDGKNAADIIVQFVFEKRKFDGSQDRFKALMKLLRPGIVISGTGWIGSDKPNQVSVYLTNVFVTKLCQDPAVVSRMIDCYVDGHVSVEEAKTALACGDDRLADLCKLRREELEEEKKQQQQDRVRSKRKAGFKQEAVKQSRLIHGLEPERPARDRLPTINFRDEQILEQNEKNQPMSFEIVDLHEDADDFSGLIDTIKVSEYQLDDALERMEYMHGKKLPQVAWMLKRIEEMKVMPKVVVDIGGGRGDLALNIAKKIPQIRVLMVEPNEPSLKVAKRTAGKLGLSNIEFHCVGVEGIDAVVGGQLQIDLVVGLHTCGGLSDAMLSFAMRSKASFLICPCCFGKHHHLRQGEEEETNDNDNDNNSNETEEQALQRLAESKRREISIRAMTIINKKRLERIAKECDQSMNLSILSFPPSISLKNYVLKGEKKFLET